MPELRIIKRYPNRRLYDTVTSSYITLDEVQELVLSQIKFKIVDSNTNEDMTNYVLLQIISEQENGHLPIFTTAILEGIIRFYGNPLQKSMSQFLEKCFSFIPENHMMSELTELTKRNFEMWQSIITQTETANKAKPKSKKTSSKKKPS